MQIEIVVFPGVTQLDFTGPAQVFTRLPDANVDVVARTTDVIPSGCGFGIAPSRSFEDAPQADLLCIPGGLGVPEAIEDRALIDHVARQAKGAKFVTSVCTGALILGAAGILQGRKATTHWAYTSLLSEVGAKYTPGRVVQDSHIFTGGGVTAGLDFALTVAAAVAGETFAKRLQLALEYDPAPPFVGGHPDRCPVEMVERVRSRYQGQVDQLRAMFRAQSSPS